MSMPLGEAALLGVVQGAFDALPVSGDGHVALAQLLYGNDADLAVSVALHLGTLAASLVVVLRRLWAALEEGVRGLRRPALLNHTPGGQDAAFVAVATVATAAS